MHTRLIKLATLLTLLVVVAAGHLVAQDSQDVGRTMPDYVIGSMDVIAVTVNSPVPQPEFSDKKYTVQNDGTIILPHLNKPIKVGGLTVKEAREAIREALIEQKQYASPIVDVLVTEYRNSSVTVQGAVRTPGSQTLRADRMTLSDAIGEAGGFLSSAGSRIFVYPGPKRPKPEPGVPVENGAEVFRRDDILQGRVSNVPVYDGDTINVEVAPHFYVTGYVKSSQSEYNWEPGVTLQKAIALAGGASPDGALNRVEVQRKDPKSGEFKKIKLAKDKMSTLIEPDDVIKVPKKRM